MMNVDAMLPLLQCPRSGTALRREADKLISERGDEYPIINGKPVLVRTILDMHVTPPEARLVSQNIAEFEVPEHLRAATAIINLGSGNVPCRDPRVISTDVLPNTNVDLVSEAEVLPLKDGVIDYLTSGAVFEHVHDPLRSIKEVRRILKDGGAFYIDTAFMQGYHGFPGHYFNMTPQAVETFIADDFNLTHSTTMGDGSIFHPVQSMLTYMIENLPESDQGQFKDMTIRDLLGEIRERLVPCVFDGRVTEFMRRTYAASVIISASKPANYEQGVRAAIDAIGADEWAALKREYYATRTGLAMEHHGVGFYRMRAVEDYGCPPEAVIPTPDLTALLDEGRVSDPLDPASWRTATEILQKSRHDLIGIRDAWIREFLTRQAAASV
jgi:SAM-dependent methyltransferase